MPPHNIQHSYTRPHVCLITQKLPQTTWIQPSSINQTNNTHNSRVTPSPNPCWIRPQNKKKHGRSFASPHKTRKRSEFAFLQRAFFNNAKEEWKIKERPTAGGVWNVARDASPLVRLSNVDIKGYVFASSYNMFVK